MQDYEGYRGGEGVVRMAMAPSSTTREGRDSRSIHGSAAAVASAGRTATLRALPLFHDLSSEDLGRLAFAASVRRVEKGRRLGSAAAGDDIAILLRGRAKRSVPRGQAAGELLLELYEAGDFVSDARWLGGAEFAGDTVAIEGSNVLVLPRVAFDGVLKGNSQVAMRLLEHFARRVARLSALATQNACMDAGDRLYCRLVELSGKYGRREDDGLLIEHGLPQRELAAFCAASREIINRQLAAWRERGWAVPRRQAVLVRDVPALTHAVGPDARRVGFGVGDGRCSLTPR